MNVAAKRRGSVPSRGTYMSSVAFSHKRPVLGIGRLRSARLLGCLGLLAWLWAIVALPALHAAQHAHEAEATPTSHRQRIQKLVDEVLWPGRAHHAEDVGPHGHRHAPTPGRGPQRHGDGSLAHLDAFFAAVPVFLVPPGFRTLEASLSALAPAAPALAMRWSPGHPRGPPLAAER